MKQALLDKYNIPVPRYTSYPPANYFHEGFSSEQYKEAICESEHNVDFINSLACLAAFNDKL